MGRKFGRLFIACRCAGLALGLLVVLLLPQGAHAGEVRMSVSVGSADADVIGSDNLAIQKAVDRVAAAGGGTVLVKAGTYLLSNSVKLASHIRLIGEGLVNLAPLITHVAGIHEYADLMKKIIAGDPGYIKGVIKLDAATA